MSEVQQRCSWPCFSKQGEKVKKANIPPVCTEEDADGLMLRRVTQLYTRQHSSRTSAYEWNIDLWRQSIARGNSGRKPVFSSVRIKAMCGEVLSVPAYQSTQKGLGPGLAMKLGDPGLRGRQRHQLGGLG
ncbi:hypothetical protein Hamer_G015011 [Homarus americanus]|uniref:Uncharacterized protein n=1 Tax=Homarus americanus TaxID=6706 RepID=A0A8J5JDE6_HOMAM|nr:hypothetical protein Hamer_G015011 [Homarus americanus]